MIKFIKRYKNYIVVLWFWYYFFLRHIHYKKNIKQILFYFYKLTPKGKKYIKDKQKKALDTIKKSVFKKKWRNNFNKLNHSGKELNFIKDIVKNRKVKLNHKISGTIYSNKDYHKKIAGYMYDLYMYSNPLHTDLFPELNKMESEIVSMVGHLFDMPENGGGNLTTGGTESTILAIKAYKKHKKNTKWIDRRLEVLTTKTGHAAINKACELLDLKLVYVNLNNDLTMDITDLKRKITSRTCVVIASYPCYPYGVIDDVKNIGDVCTDYNVPLHVDACLGGFITQFDENLKLSFKDNIDSISVDPHKFGYAPKGSSLLLWKDNEIKHNQYFIVENWTGGIYASCSLPGSRAGAQIATTWAIMIYNGYNYYKTMSETIIKATKNLYADIIDIPSFKVIGNPNVNVVAFYSDKYPLSQIIDEFQKHNWNLNILQNPMCVHICITPYNYEKLYEITDILKNIITQEVRNETKGLVSIYGMAEKIPNRNVICEIIEQYLDLTTKL